MKVEYIMLADKAEGINGKLYVMGGGWDRMTPPTVPTLVSYDVIVSLRFSQEDDRQQTVQLVLEGPDGAELLGPIGGPLQVPAEVLAGRLHVVLGGPFPVQSNGKHRWVVLANGEPIADQAFEVEASLTATPDEASTDQGSRDTGSEVPTGPEPNPSRAKY